MRVLIDLDHFIFDSWDFLFPADPENLFTALHQVNATVCFYPVFNDTVCAQYFMHVLIPLLNRYKIHYVNLQQEHKTARALRQFTDYDGDHHGRCLDSQLLNQLYGEKVDFLISESGEIKRKAKLLNLYEYVYDADEFLEKLVAERRLPPANLDVTLQKQYMHEVNFNQVFFESFRNDYNDFDDWVRDKSKANEFAYVAQTSQKKILAFLCLDVEIFDDCPRFVTPEMPAKKRLRIASMKVASNGFKLAERMMRIVFEAAKTHQVDEIYIEIFNHGKGKLRLIELLQKWGFSLYGHRQHANNFMEEVLVRPLYRGEIQSTGTLSQIYPCTLSSARGWLVPIRESYYEQLFSSDVTSYLGQPHHIEYFPQNNALTKLLITRIAPAELQSADILFFLCRHVNGAILSHIAVVVEINTQMQNEKQFIEYCRKYSVLSDTQLRSHWYSSHLQPAVIRFLDLGELPRTLYESDIEKLGLFSKMPQHMEKLTARNLRILLRATHIEFPVLAEHCEQTVL
ncbi:hypothetical protein [Celerinatantimonas sp. MCCC 1A17872]|uniref:hypothetical protein n=1 Tax=Celerinatantimonas sp. MCCC 1A17872 TaxID=3177514 RepID=UPI0038C9D6E9